MYRNRALKIHSCFTEPPSEIACFRDVTLFAQTWVFEDVLLECPRGTRKLYWDWLKSHGAHDFISELIREGEGSCYYTIKPNTPANIVVDRINYDNLQYIIGRLNCLRRHS